MVEQGSACIADIALEFGCEYINMDGTLNRRKMARTVFGDKAKLKKLNSLMFPYIIEEIRGELARLKEEQGGLIVLDAPTLFRERRGRGVRLCRLGHRCGAPSAKGGSSPATA